MSINAATPRCFNQTKKQKKKPRRFVGQGHVVHGWDAFSADVGCILLDFVCRGFLIPEFPFYNCIKCTTEQKAHDLSQSLDVKTRIEHRCNYWYSYKQ